MHIFWLYIKLLFIFFIELLALNSYNFFHTTCGITSAKALTIAKFLSLLYNITMYISSTHTCYHTSKHNDLNINLN